MTDHARPCGVSGDYAVPNRITVYPDKPRSLDPEGYVGVAYAQARHELDELAEIAGAAIHERNTARDERDAALQENERLRYALAQAAERLADAPTPFESVGAPERSRVRQRLEAARQIREVLGGE